MLRELRYHLAMARGPRLGRRDSRGSVENMESIALARLSRLEALQKSVRQDTERRYREQVLLTGCIVFSQKASTDALTAICRGKFSSRGVMTSCAKLNNYGWSSRADGM